MQLNAASIGRKRTALRIAFCTRQPFQRECKNIKYPSATLHRHRCPWPLGEHRGGWARGWGSLGCPWGLPLGDTRVHRAGGGGMGEPPGQEVLITVRPWISSPPIRPSPHTQWNHTPAHPSPASHSPSLGRWRVDGETARSGSLTDPQGRDTYRHNLFTK